MANVSTKVVENIKTHFMFKNFIRSIVPFLDNMEKYSTARQTTDDNIT